MRQMNILAIALAVACFGASTGPALGQTAFEGARLIVGNGSRHRERNAGRRWREDHADSHRRRYHACRRAQCAWTSSGKTVMPMMVDTHVHLAPTRDGVMRDLKRRAYFGVSTVISMGQDNYELLDLRGQTIPGAARFLSAGRGITMPEPGRITVPYWIDSEDEARKAVRELAEKQGRYRQDLGRHPRRQIPEAQPRDLYGPIIDEAHKRGLRVAAHIFDLEDAKGLLRAGSTPLPMACATRISTTNSSRW